MTGPLPHGLTTDRPPQIGLIVLQADETIELEFRRMVPAEVELFVSRVPSGAEVTPDTLAAMEGHLAGAAALFPEAARFGAVGYACTSGTAQIGAARVADRIRSATTTRAVTEPVSALIAACRALGVGRLALVSPYVAAVSDRLRDVLASAGIAMPELGSFDIAEEARVARIDPASIMAAARDVAGRGGSDAVFLSCTNLRSLGTVAALEADLGVPVLSSNQVLAWHLMMLAGIRPGTDAPGRLFAAGATSDHGVRER